MPGAFDSYSFRNVLNNPHTRAPQYHALKGRALFDQIKDLLRWEQMQELTPWFRTVDIVMMHL
jgi:hypothetical protein